MTNSISFFKEIYRYMRPAIWTPSQRPRYSGYDLRRLDFQYWQMYKGHEELHSTLVREIADRAGVAGNVLNVLEVACGTGWNITNFLVAGFNYYGLDISETAISLALRRQSECRFLNFGILDANILRDSSFDIVYSSSMLEHVGFIEDALGEMIRLTKHHLFVIFFEGLSTDKENTIRFFPYSDNQISGQAKDIFGRKVVLQDHVVTKQKGYYWNRYSRASVEAIMEKNAVRYEILDRQNRSFIDQQTVLHVMKET
jgi:ubiquinone/menaquinone biosynthesis C-methylase UbiE